MTLAGCGGQSASGGDDPASAVPADAAMYFEAVLRPEGSQRDDALAAAGKVLATGDPSGKIEQLVSDALSKSDGLELDYGAFGRLVGVAQSRGGLAARPVSVRGAESAFAFSVPDSPKPVVAARSKDKVVIAYGEAAASDALSPSGRLADSPTYAAAKAALGDGMQPGFVLAMPPVVSLIGSAAEDRAEFARAKPYLDAFSVIAAGSKVDGDMARSRVVAGLK